MIGAVICVLCPLAFAGRHPHHSSGLDMGFADSVSLHGQHVSLVPLEHSHHDSLVEALKDGELWSLWYTSVPTPDRLRAEIDRRLALQQQGSMVPFAVIEISSG